MTNDQSLVIGHYEVALVVSADTPAREDDGGRVVFVDEQRATGAAVDVRPRHDGRVDAAVVGPEVSAPGALLRFESARWRDRSRLAAQNLRADEPHRHDLHGIVRVGAVA